MNFVFTWEFGGGMGHLAEVVPVARECRRRGHAVSLALKSLRHLDRFLPLDRVSLLDRVSHGERSSADEGIRFHQAPNDLARSTRRFPVTATYGQLLHNLGFGDRTHLRLKATAWRNLFALLKPDLIVCDHAPLGMLAARSLAIPYVNLGTGFTCPPTEPRFPTLKPAFEPPPAVLAEQAARLVEHANEFLADHGRPALDRLEDLYPAPKRTLLATYAELDHFPERAVGSGPRSNYLGSWPFGVGAVPEFPPGDGPRIFGYLKPFPALEPLLSEIRRLRLPTLICGTGLADALKQRLAAPTLRFSEGPVELAQALRRCDFALLNASHGVVSAALRAGKPIFNLPLQLEQSLLAKRIMELQAGIAAAPKDAAACLRALHAMLELHPRLRAGAETFAAKYRDHEPQQAIETLVDELGRVS